MRAVAWMFQTALKLMLLMSLPLLISGSGLALRGPRADVRYATRPYEFDFASWTLRALAVKGGQAALDGSAYVAPEVQTEIVREWIDWVEREGRLEAELERAIADPEADTGMGEIDRIREELRLVRQQRSLQQPFGETMVEQQVGQVLAELGFERLGVVFPPPAFHMTDLPYALIVSPRHVIRQDANVQLDTDMELSDRIRLEERVESQQDVSALVVPVGGYGTYPTMVQQTASLDWLLEVVVHEWVHNYLALRPLGARYDVSGDLRTMNETAASLFGQTVGEMALRRFYPDLAPPTENRVQPASPAELGEPEPSAESEPAAFDFRAEMRHTREAVDQMLEAGQIEQAEAYMEARRQVFWDHGFQIRRLNQAYFAFHGSYADQPGGPAGDDPVGEAVRELWRLLDDPVVFLRSMAVMRHPDDLQTELGRLEGAG